jgi:hypothetical protein
MTPKEKAEELVNKHLNINLSQVDDLVDGIRIRLAQENALITVNNILSELQTIHCYGENDIEDSTQWYEEVKQELEQL